MSKIKQQRKDLEALSPSLKSWGEGTSLPKKNVVIECGWGRLIIGHTFEKNTDIANILRDERPGYRDIALYLRDPQVVVAKAPQELFIDPSVTYRKWLDDTPSAPFSSSGFTVREIVPEQDFEAVNRIYRARGMVEIDQEFLQNTYKGKFIHYFVAEDKETEVILGVAMGVDHKLAFDDPENGTSIWAVAVDPQASHPGIGRALIDYVMDFFRAKKRSFLDVSVLHDNVEAIALYEKLGFTRIPAFCVKNKNAINEKLFTAPPPKEKLNPYAMIIVNEARRRGIRVDVLDEEDNYFRLSQGARSIVCRESLSELTSAVAMSRCSDKQTTHRLLARADLRVPAQAVAGRPADNQAFLKEHHKLVVKPAIGEQGMGIVMDVTTKNELAAAIEHASHFGDKVLLEEMVSGEDLRVIVIDFKVVAAAVRRPPSVAGDGKYSILELVKKQSRRREKATQGESKIPLDEELKRTVENAGYTLDDVLSEGQRLTVRKTANLHTGGTIHDVTDQLHPTLAEAARKASQVLDIPVVGLDFMVKSPMQPDYYIIEANERPGLANHEPQPTAERFVDLLFPETRGQEPKA